MELQRAVIDAHFLPGNHFDALVKELQEAKVELHYDEWLKLIFIRKGEKKIIEKIAQKYDQKVEF
ncbi:MAG: hypothetical protein J7L14_03695 [Candidatus Diapherotrites archaeon]|nr:hypothetical protein [Candidatus Diapherotrites archaeon]